MSGDSFGGHASEPEGGIDAVAEIIATKEPLELSKVDDTVGDNRFDIHVVNLRLPQIEESVAVAPDDPNLV
ncbi:MAG TPA: hypothetical protein VLF90_02780 [Patescibacteria group bacterium]|nr:hypothetical protein [Patescibacteria group bacterium]